MVTVITAYLFYIIKAVAAERVAECGGLLSLTEKFRFPDILLSKREQKVADICQNRPFSPLVER
jgi:hypothetical protein